MVSVWLADPIGKLFGFNPIGMYSTGIAFALGLVIFYPAMVVGTLLWSYRIVGSQISQQEETQDKERLLYLDLPVSLVEKALQVAKANNASTVRIEQKQLLLEQGSEW
ncbi:MAG: hypothetical protein QXJ17_03985 [Nitrososphaeria archaeon]